MDYFPTKPLELSHVVAYCDSRTRFPNKVNVALNFVVSSMYILYIGILEVDFQSTAKNTGSEKWGFGSQLNFSFELSIFLSFKNHFYTISLNK